MASYRTRPTHSRFARPWMVLFALAWAASATTAPASAQPLSIETAGDVLMKSLPVVVLGSTAAVPDRTGAGQFLLGFGINAATTGGLKLLIDKPRPDASNNHSFPSGHTSIAFQSASFIHFRYGLAPAVPVYGVASFVGYSRVQARKHFVEDVLVGFAIGVLSSRVVTDRRGDPDPEPTLDLGMTLRFGNGQPPRLLAGGAAPWH